MGDDDIAVNLPIQDCQMSWAQNVTFLDWQIDGSDFFWGPKHFQESNGGHFKTNAPLHSSEVKFQSCTLSPGPGCAQTSRKLVFDSLL